MIIDLYCFCWNEADMVGFLFRHYDPFVRRYVIYDMGSADGTEALLQSHPRVELRPRPAFDPDIPKTVTGLSLLETCWRESSGDADWVIITDFDEHLHHRDLLGYLRFCKDNGITIVPALGYQMLSESMPEEGRPLSETVTTGAPWVNMNKLNLFDPQAIDRLNYAPGRHAAHPTGRVVAPDRDELLLLHYKYLDFERVMRRHEQRSRRLNARDMERGSGYRWLFSRSKLREDWLSFEERAVDVSRGDLEPWLSHPAPRWWEPFRRSKVLGQADAPEEVLHKPAAEAGEDSSHAPKELKTIAGPDPQAGSRALPIRRAKMTKNSTSLGWDLEREGLDRLGYSAPLPLAEPQRAAGVLARHRDDLGYIRNPHRSSEEVLHLLNDPALIDSVQRLCGKGFRLWRSAFFRKSEGSAEIGWHHDKHFFDAGEDDIRLDEIGTHFSILFGLSDIVQTTGLLQMIPGSHRKIKGLSRDTRPYHKRPLSAHILSDLSEEFVAQARPVPIPAGSFVLFHSAILHRSLPHTKGAARLGLAIRLAGSGVRIPTELADPGDATAFPPPSD